MDPKSKIRITYKEYILREFQKPPSFEVFCKWESWDGLDVREHYSTFIRIERDILLETFETTIERLVVAPEFATYSAREKILAFFFTWFEELAEIREILHVVDESEIPGLRGVRYLKEMEVPFKGFVQGVLSEGMETGEVASRQVVAGYYPTIFWLELRFLLHYWLNDESEAYEQTDAAIEKTVNFVFDIVAPNVLDSGFDLVKFLIKR